MPGRKILLGKDRGPTSADACGEKTGCDDGRQEVTTCSTRGGTQGMYIYIHSPPLFE